MRVVSAILAAFCFYAVLAGSAREGRAQVAGLGEPHLFVSERIGPDGPTPQAQVQSELLVPGEVVAAHIEYGPTPAYGQQTPEEPQAGASISVNFDALPFGVLTHYRVVATVDGRNYAGPNATLFLPYPALHLPARLDVRVAGAPFRGRTRVRNLTLSGVPRGTRVQLFSCVFRRDPLCSRAGELRTSGAPAVFMRGRTFAAGTGATVTAVQPDGQVIDTEVRFRPAGPPEVSVACGLARPGETDYSEQPCVAIRTVSRARSARLSLRVEGAQKGMIVDVRCRGAGCPRARTVYRVNVPVAGVARTVVPRGYSRLRPGSVVDVLVTRPRTTGVARRITVGRRGVVVGAYRCVARDSVDAVIGCPGGLHLPFPAAPAAVQLY